MNRKLPLIAIDLGGTIEDSWASKRHWFAARGIDLGVWPLGRREIVNRIGGQESFYEMMVAEVYSDDNILARECTAGFVDVVRTLAAQFRVAVLTSRTERGRQVTLEWLKRRCIHEHLTDITFLGNEGDKVGWCESSGARFFIDDDIRHLERIAPHSRLLGIHYLQQPPCVTPPSRHGVFQAFGWAGVLSIVRSAPSAPIGNWPDRA